MLVRLRHPIRAAEMLVLLSAASLAVLATAAHTMPGLRRDPGIVAVSTVHTCLQLARIEAIRRGRPCVFEIDASRRTLRVSEEAVPVAAADGPSLHEADLPGGLAFVRPDSGPPITLAETARRGRFRAAFGERGEVLSGAGRIHLRGGDVHFRITVLDSGDLELHRWDGTDWKLL